MRRLRLLPLSSDMDLTIDEEPVFRRAVAAYLDAKIDHKGQYRGQTADQFLDELNTSASRWTQLASFVIETADGPKRRNR